MGTAFTDSEGLVLAGGSSSRFGMDKAAFSVNGVPMIKSVVDAMAPLVATIRISISVPDRNYDPRLEHVVDRFPGCGPIAGLHAGLLRCEAPWLLIVATDFPFVSTALLSRLLFCCSDRRVAVLSRDANNRIQPLCACYRTDILPEVENNLRKGHLSMRELCDAISEVVYVNTDANELRNINRPEDVPG